MFIESLFPLAAVLSGGICYLMAKCGDFILPSARCIKMSRQFVRHQAGSKKPLFSVKQLFYAII